jgi:predicted nucleic acid-binding protein
MAIDSCLVDTNVLLRTVRFNDPQYLIIDSALTRLASAGATLYYTQQNIAEFWNVMTRPIARNGLGLTIDQAEREIKLIESEMKRLPESDAAYREWRRIVFENKVAGSQVHDARLVAAMHVHGLRHILTLNVGDFMRYSGIEVVHPAEIP